MIKSFARSQHGKRTAAFVAGERIPQFEEFAAQAARRLTNLRDATCLQDLQNLPSNHFHALTGKLGHGPINEMKMVGGNLPVR